MEIPATTEMVLPEVSDAMKIEFAELKSSASPPVYVHPSREAKSELLQLVGEVTTQEDSLLVDLYDSAFALLQTCFEDAPEACT